MDKKLIERIALEVADSITAPFISDESMTRFAHAFLARIDAERGKEAVAFVKFWAGQMCGSPDSDIEYAEGLEVCQEGDVGADGEKARPVFLSAPTIPEGWALISIADKDMLTRQAHTTNEWADAACNGLQWMRNVHDRISDPGAAIMAIEDNIKHCREVAAAQGERNAQ